MQVKIGPIIQTPNPNSIDYSSVFFVNTDTGYVVGGNGTILKTINGGSDWTTQLSGTSNWLGSVYFTDGNTGYAAGSQETILKTDDGGTNWIKHTFPENPTIIKTSSLNNTYYTLILQGLH